MADEKNAADQSTAHEDVPAAGSELTDGQLDKVAGGMDPLHLLAQVNHLAAQANQVKARAVIDDDGPRLP